MSSREIVRRCIEFRDPPRIGLHFNVSPIDGRRWTRSDFAGVRYGPDPDWVAPDDHTKEWGTEYESFDETGENMGQTKVHPLGEGWHALDTYRFPDFTKEARYTHLSEQVARLHDQGRYVYGSVPSLMQLGMDLRGIENWFMDNAAEQEQLSRFLDLVLDARRAIIERYADAGVDAAITYDDMGTNDRPLVSPAVFRDIYFSRYKATCDALHERGMHFIHHCCGQVREYVDMFIEAGCDVLQLDQPRLMGIDWLSERFSGRLCFWNPIDIQTTILSNDPAAIEDEAHHQVWAFGRHGGGFMVKAYQQPNAIGISAEASQAQYDAFLKYAEYPLVPYR